MTIQVQPGLVLNDQTLNGPEGLYAYKTTFSLTGFDPSTAKIIGNWSTDNNGVSILLNGVDTGNPSTDSGQFSIGFAPFSISSGFQPGINTLEFIVNNNELATALRVEMTGTANPVSNVIFLPGALGSRLYHCNELTEKRIWEPHLLKANDELQLMRMDDQAPPGITYTRDIIDVIDTGFNGGEVYNDFSQFMDNTFGKNSWEKVPYDWRRDLLDLTEQIVTGTKDGCEAGGVSLIKNLTKVLIDRAKLTGKVTIVTHSNGGLLAKLLIQQPKPGGGILAELVDKLIMVAAPQLGSPSSIISLLHGDYFPSELADLAARDDVVRDVLHTWPGAYTLIPDGRLFDEIFPKDVIVFENDTSILPWKYVLAQYGSSIDSYSELGSFVLGNDARNAQHTDVGGEPQFLNPTLLQDAEGIHEVIDSFTPPVDLKVYQIAGWGQSTIKGITYTFQDGTSSAIMQSANYTWNGDKTVIIQSAVATANAKTYYLNLRKCGSHNKHNELMANGNVQKLIRNILAGDENVPVDIDVDCVKADSLPSGLSLNSFLVRGASPIELHAFDSIGRHTGPIPAPEPGSQLAFFETSIPNSNYVRIDHTQDITFNAENGPYRIDIRGTGTGPLTLTIQEFSDDQMTGEIQYHNIPITEKTRISAKLGILGDARSLDVDVDGDGIVDKTITPNVAPIANAGPDQTVRLGSLVTLNGSASTDPDNGPSSLSYAWTQTDGPGISLTDAATAGPKFTPSVKGFYTFNLVVNDGESDSPSASVKITVPTLGDIDLDNDVDSNDLARITAVLNKPANGPNDLRDINGDMKIDALDSRKLVLLCTKPRCATQ